MNERNEKDKTETEISTDEINLESNPVDITKLLYNAAQGPYSKKVDELEALLENLQGKLSDVVAHMDYVKRKKDDLCATALTLKKQKKPESCDESSKAEEEEREKTLKDVFFEIKTRGQVLKMLEKRELILSHAILSVVSNWGDEMEKNLETKDSTKSLHEDTGSSHLTPD